MGAKALFDACVDLPKSAQRALIAAANASDEVKAHVTELLQHANKNIDLTQAVVDSVQVSLDIKPLKAGMKIDAFQLVKKIGEGGQGEVWLAERSAGDFNQQVAIKFLKPVHDEHELSRFQAERKTLATLKHPNIAQLIGGGELENNRPYMVIELVEGQPLLQYAKHHNFSLKAYLKCFLQICEAISYAHSFSVIHRDIKPSNIFITADGTVKLLDFGIAKFVDGEAVKTATLPIMTLAYSSPEQVTGEPVSTATDVYALGLLLYEMLTGRRAQAHDIEVPAKMIEEITQNSPLTPSSMAAQLNLVRNYHIKNLKGDLDNLIMMALRKEPERRYATVKDMANDIKNFLDGKPLVAVGDGWWYKTKKFISRNPASAAMSTALLMFLIGLPLALLYNQKLLTAERDKAVAAQQQAQEQSIVANRTTDFLVNILESASPLGHKGEDIKLQDVLISAERQLANGLDNQPKIKAELLSKLAGIHHHLGNTPQSVEHYQVVLSIYESLNDLPGQLNALGQLVVMSNFANQQDLAVAYQQQAETIKAQVKDIKALAWHEAKMATLANQLNQRAAVESNLLRVMQELEQNSINDADLLGRIYNELSISAKDPQTALKYNLAALDFAQQLHGQMHPQYLNRLKNLANRYKQLELYKEAELTLLDAIEKGEKLYSKDHPFYGSVLAELGALYHDKGRFSEVEEIYLSAMEISQRLTGEESLNYVLEVNNLGYLYEDMGRYKDAEALYKKSIKLREQFHAQSPTRIASSKSNLARLLAKMGRHQASLALLQEIQPAFIEYNMSQRQNTITQIANKIGSEKNNCNAALAEIREILPEVKQMSGKSWRRMHNELWLGEMAYRCEDLELANNLLASALSMSASIYTENSEGQIMVQNRTQPLLNKIN